LTKEHKTKSTYFYLTVKVKIKGKYRKQLYLTFDKIKYNKRNIVEATFSVVKKVWGSNKGKKILQSSE